MVEHIRKLAQGNSLDCGYFCGYVLKVAHDHQGNYDNWCCSADQVLGARDAWRRSAGLRQGSYRLHYNDIVRFLGEQLGLPGYQPSPIPPPMRGTAAEALRARINPLLHSGYGVMVLVVPAGGGDGHYIDILPGSAPNAWHYYDPSEQPPNCANQVDSMDLATAIADRAQLLIHH